MAQFAVKSVSALLLLFLLFSTLTIVVCCFPGQISRAAQHKREQSVSNIEKNKDANMKLKRMMEEKAENEAANANKVVVLMPGIKFRPFF